MLQVKRSGPVTKSRLISALRMYFPGVWIDPRRSELIALYRLRYNMAMEGGKYDTAMIFLNKIIELDQADVQAKLCKGEIYHRCLKDYGRAIEQYKKVMTLTTSREQEELRAKAREAISEIMEMLS